MKDCEAEVTHRRRCRPLPVRGRCARVLSNSSSSVAKSHVAAGVGDLIVGA